MLTKSTKRNLALMGALTTAVVGLIVYGVLTHKESGLLQACATLPARVADYTGTCFDVKWHKLPLSVYGIGDKDQARVLRNEVGAINAQLGFHALKISSSADADVSVLFNQAPAKNLPKEGGTTTHYFAADNFAKKAEIRVYNVVLIELLGPVIQHELGHAIGLAHDDFRSSIMMIGSGTGSRITDYDRALLRKLYK